MSIFQKITVVRRLFRRTGNRIWRELHRNSEKPVKIWIWLTIFLFMIPLLALGVVMVIPPLANVDAMLPIFLVEIVTTLNNALNKWKWLSPLIIGSFVLMFFVWQMVQRWGSRRHFREHYDKYKIKEYGFWRSPKILRYAVFAEQLEESKLSKEDVRKVAEWLKILETPPRRDTFLRTPVGAIMLALLINLFLLLVRYWVDKDLASWITISMLMSLNIMLLLLGSAWFGIYRSIRDTEAELQQFLTLYLMEKNEEPIVLG